MTGSRRIIKNAAFDFFLRSVDVNGQVTTGATISGVTISKDNAAFGAPAGGSPAAATENPAVSGVIKVALQAGDTGCAFIHGNLAFSAGARTPEPFYLETEPCIDSGVAQGGAAGYLTGRAAYAGADGALEGFLIEIVRGTGADQKMRLCYRYTTADKRAYVYPDWSTVPDNTSVYKVVELPGQDNLLRLYSGLRVVTLGAGSDEQTLNIQLTGLGTDAFRNAVVMGYSNNGNRGFMRQVSNYDSGTGVLTLYVALPAAPATGDKLLLFGLGG